MYRETTHAIQVTVKAAFLEDQSSPGDDHYVWSYNIEIENRSQSTVQLLTRHWQITDANGRMQEVRGDGVVGERPILRPGERFAYTSGTPLQTPSGIMVGSYQMISDSGERLDVAIPAFSLDSPHQTVSLN